MDKPIPLNHFVNDILSAFKNSNSKKLRKLHDVVLKETVIHFTKPKLELAVMAYVLSKIITKPRFMKKENSQKLQQIEFVLKDLARNIDRFPENQVLRIFNDLERRLTQLEEGDSRFLTSLMEKGNLKSAAVLYAQGMSLGVAADITGVGKQDIQNYAGKTQMFDRLIEDSSIHKRMKVARRLTEV
ncbi:MAG: hypothetical protein ABIJ34_04130 [archaeon]